MCAAGVYGGFGCMPLVHADCFVSLSVCVPLRTHDACIMGAAVACARYSCVALP